VGAVVYFSIAVEVLQAAVKNNNTIRMRMVLDLTLTIKIV
jgi:hypothetical protein